IGVILGANIGTTVTAQLIAFKIEAYALPAIGAGVFLKFFVGRRKWAYVGDVLLGFGLVFYGLSTMKMGIAPLRGDPTFISFFTRFNAENMGGILLAVLVGTVMTMILQSSSATVGIVMALASQGLLDFQASVALILGDNIGTTITAQLASVGANTNARQTANAHTLFNVFGVIYVILFFPLFIKLIMWVTSNFLGIGPPDLIIAGERPNIARYIANSHTLFNVVNTLFFLLILPYLVKAATWLTPKRKDEEEFNEFHHIKYLDSKYVDTPAVALEQARAEIVRMGEAVQAMYDDVIKALNQRRLKELSKWRKQEDTLDNLRKEIGQFLVRVMQESIMPEESSEVASLMRINNNLERFGDAIENIAQLMEDLIEENLYLSDKAGSDYGEITSEVRKFLSLTINAIKTDDKEVMAKAQEMEDKINAMEEAMKKDHVMRLQRGVCEVDQGIIFEDMLTAFEKMGDYCYNISQAIAGLK
ncbi:MAG: Na/Pi cotransporter family protein, partial [Desulfobacteraceae bacterium]|nr:Na/Pi cotransporter family protein [Desulfobacteraceae bacterium]